MIIRQKKFDIRQWVLVTDWNPLTVWIYDECYVRLAAVDYDPTSLDRITHLTNNCVVKRFYREEYGNEDDDDSDDCDTTDENLDASDSYNNYNSEEDSEEEHFDNIMSADELSKYIQSNC